MQSLQETLFRPTARLRRAVGRKVKDLGRLCLPKPLHSISPIKGTVSF
jgi:hypothetical protein